MKKTLGILGRVFAAVALVLVLGQAGSFSAAASSPARGMPQGTFEIGFDGYCDGMLINIDNMPASWELYGNRTGCASELIAGSVVFHIAGGPHPQGVGISLMIDGFDGAGYYTTLSFVDHTWAHYDVSGGMINSGTFHFGPPLAADAASSLK